MHLSLQLVLLTVAIAIGTDLAFHDLAVRMVGLLGMRRNGNSDGKKLLLPNRANARPTITPLEPIELIRQEGYPSEAHFVETKDGYILTVYRIPGPINSTAVYLQHGLLENSLDWLIPGRKKSLAYILADSGYDVWLGNARGNTYSKKHRKLSTANPRFWDFSWHELGVYDLPAVISYIWSIKRDNLFYVGHSMGATSFSVMAVEKPEIAEKVKAAFVLAPATYVYHMRAPIKMIAPFWRNIQRLANIINMQELLPRSPFFNAFAEYICGSFMFRKVLCGNLLFIIAGFNPEQFNYSLLQNIWSSFPAGTSMKLFIHWLQQINMNDFRNFDYGPEGNLKVYDSIEPPRYDLSKVQTPVAVFWSSNDLLVGEEDTNHFYDDIPLKLGIYKINDSRFNHFDFLWGVNAPELVYATILDLMDDVDNQIIRK